MLEYRQWDYRNTLLADSRKWYQCVINRCRRTFASERNCALHIRAHHPMRFRCDIDQCGTTYDFRTPFTKHVRKEHQKFVPDGAFTTLSVSASPSPKQKRTRQVPEGFVLVDIAPSLDFEPVNQGRDTSVIKNSIRTTEDASRSPVADVEKITSSMPIGSDQPPPEEERRSAKRRASFIDDDHTNDRTIRAKFCKPKPEYQIQQSTKYPGQQIALDWLSENGKRYHDWIFEVLIGRWGGVKPIHRGTCVLCPDEWRLKTPSCLAPIRDPSLLPGPGAVPLVFSYSDYTTSFSRAAAWFQGGRWPRSGKEHDAFLGADKLEAMEASHTCHQQHCIVHLTYEQLDESLDRKRCALWARSLRHAGHSIPEKCHCHSPPCLLQVRSQG